jgi:hypothetical protein
VDEVERAKNRAKSKVRAKVEHPIGIIKRVFGFAKVRYRGLKKHPSPARDLRIRQSVHGPPAAIASAPGRNLARADRRTGVRSATDRRQGPMGSNTGFEPARSIGKRLSRANTPGLVAAGRTTD